MVQEDERGNVITKQQEGEPVGEEEENIEALRAELQSLKNELREAKEAAEISLNKTRYLMADFDNYRKQMEKQPASTADSITAEWLVTSPHNRDD